MSTRSSTPIARIAHPLAFGAFLEEVGAPVHRHFRRQGLPFFCDNPDNFVPLRRAWSFFDAASRAEDLSLGWHVGRFVGDHNLSDSLLRRLETAPTLYQALKTFIRLASSESSDLQLGILERRDDILFFTNYPDMRNVRGYHAAQAYQLSVYIDLIRHFLGERWVPEEIGIEHLVVPAVVKEHFPGSRVLPGQRVGFVSVPRDCLHTAAPARQSESTIDEPVVLTKDFSFPDTLAAVIKAYLPDGYPSANKVAPLMDTSTRTMARRLVERGLTYQELIDQVRFNLARELLQEDTMTVGDVGIATGFSDPTHFARMFRRIGGLSPLEFRKSAQGRAD